MDDGTDGWMESFMENDHDVLYYKWCMILGLACQGKDIIVFKFFIEYS
jgi:hypothetical protein